MKNTRLSVALLAVVALGVTACETDLTGLNKNPNSPSIDTPPPPGTIFTNAIANSAGYVGGAGYQNSGVSLLAQHTAQAQYVDEDRFAYRSGTIDGYFNGPYVADLMDYEQVYLVGQKNKDPNTWGPARVMQTLMFQTMTDMFGDIPYSEALQGTAGSTLKPKYDAQKDIYYGMLKTLTDANAAMGSGTGLGAGDPIYAGNAAKWRKFANALRLRLAMRLQKADAAKATAELAAAIAAPGGLMTSNADNAQVNWPGDDQYNNPWAGNFATRDDYRMSKTLMDVLVANADPRTPIYAQPTTADPTKYAGEPNGLDNASASGYMTAASRIGAMFYPGKTTYGTFGTAAGKAAPTFLVTFAEQNFILAEAANRGIGGLNAGQAKAYYDAGVTASITQWGGTAAQAAAYLAQPAIAYQGGAAGLTQILTQKWIAFFTQGQEAWADWRRTGIPANIVPGPKATLSYIPRRMMYATTEQTVNKEQLDAAIARQGADAMNTRVWWDK
ncbi:MAG: SusD/RagB family nutrient-binding outer membrane lipoprotein [Gemmatimonadaceae bacterium]|nr:SusD/RagB family nutrient-binding outer membrane lipoprotein [Gemmatimonadaceae bacterium]